MMSFLERHKITLIPWLLLAAAGIYYAILQQHDVLHLDMLTHPLAPFDTDNWIRLTQVRQWITGGDFFDHAVRHTNAPFGGIDIHWTRPVDALLRFFAGLMPPVYTVDQRLMMAAAWLPPLLGALGMAVLVATTRKMLDHKHVLWCLMSLAVTNIVRSNYFAPGYADHHGPLCVLWCGVLCLMVTKPSRYAALGMGLLLGLMLWISVEAFLPLAAIYALLGLFGLYDAKEMRTFSLVSTGAAVVSVVGLMIEKRPSEIFTILDYDTLSIVYVTLLSMCAAGVVLLERVFLKIADIRGRVGVAAATGAVILLAMFLTYPKFFKGPLADSDPFIFTDFLPNIVEARSLMATLKIFPPLFIIDVFQAALAAFLIFVTWKSNLWRRNRRQMIVLSLLLVYTFVMTAVQVRWNYYMQPVAMVLVAALLPLWAVRSSGPALRWLRMGFAPYARPYVIIYLLSLLAAVPMYFSAQLEDDLANCEAYMQYDVTAGSVQKSLGAAPLNLLTTPHLAGPVQFFTPYRVIAGNYNREGQGLKDLDAILKAPDFESARPLLEKRKIDAVLLCPAAHDDDTWISKLSDEKNLPAWITPVPAKKPKYPRKIAPAIFRVNTSLTGTTSTHPSAEGSCARGCELPDAR